MTEALRAIEGERVEVRDPRTPPLPPGFVLFKNIDPTPQKIWLVENFLGAGEMSCMFGAPGSAKSILCGDLAAHVGAGMNFFGRRVEQGGVLYVALERAAVVKRRLAAWRHHHGVDDIPLAVLAQQYDLRTTAAADQIIAAARYLEHCTGCVAKLVIIETVNRALAGGDENSPKDMGALINGATRILEAMAAHLLFVHHIPADGQQRLRGHGALLGACDTTIRVEKVGALRTATLDKVNDGEEGQRLTFDLTSIDLHHDPETGITTTAPVIVPQDGQAQAERAPSLTKNQQTMFAILFSAGRSGLSVEEWNARAREAGLGVSRKADLYDLRESLKSKVLVHRFGEQWVTAK